MTLSYRPYEDTDLELLQNCIMEWRKANPDGTYCHPGDIPHRLYNGNRGVMTISDITRIYMQGDTVVALLLSYPRHVAMDVFVHPDLQEEHDLLLPIIQSGYQIVCDYLHRQGETKREQDFYVDCFHTDTQRQSLLTKAGFCQKENAINLTRRSLNDLPDSELPDGFTIRSATMEDAEQLANVHNKSFTSKWTADIYRNEVMLKPGYEPEREFIVVAHDGTFAAFTVTWLDETNKVGLFEPVGTHEDYRRMGLARAMMNHVMREMKTKGMVEAEVCFGTSNPSAQALYTGLGFEICHHIYDWKRILEREQA